MSASTSYLSVLGDLQHDVVVQDVDGVVHRVDGQICGPFQSDLDKETKKRKSLTSLCC